jgi:hypothetical protein
VSAFCRYPHRIGLERVPRLITTAADALTVFHLARAQPPSEQVIVLVLHERVGHTALIVDGTDDPDAVVGVVELVTEAAPDPGPAELVVATIRPNDGPLPGDAERWMELTTMAEEAGCELLEWFVISGETAWCPRDLLAEPPRW